jgi:hypothetical protein
MDATMDNKTNMGSKVIGALALLLTISACGQGFKTRQSESVATIDSRAQNFRTSAPVLTRKPASATPTPVAATKAPVAANDNQPLNFKFLTLATGAQAKVLQRYSHIDRQHEINTKLLKDALLFYFVNQKNFMNNKVITVIDYSLPSSQKRLFVIELGSGRVWSTYVAHGRGSDKDHDGLPEIFTNRKDSNATSLGPFLTMSPYKGENGLSLRMKGLSKWNSNALERNVVIHGAAYVHDEAVRQGRSWGCPAVAPKYIAKLISIIKGGSLVYSGASNPSLHHQM